MNDITKVHSFPLIPVISNRPSRSVAAPDVVPLTYTVAPVNGSPVELSFTTPFKVAACTNAAVHNSNSVIKLFFMFTSVFFFIRCKGISISFHKSFKKVCL